MGTMISPEPANQPGVADTSLRALLRKADIEAGQPDKVPSPLGMMAIGSMSSLLREQAPRAEGEGGSSLSRLLAARAWAG